MTQEFVTLPREVAEQAVAYIEMLNAGKWTQVTALAATLRASLDQPQNHVPDAGNMVPAGWKLVPVEPTQAMIDQMRLGWSDISTAYIVDRWKRAVAAAPKPPTVKESLTVKRPQSEQPAMTPIAQRKLDDLVAIGYTISGYSVYHEQKHQHGFVTGAGLVGWWKPEGVEYPQQLGGQEPDWQDMYRKEKRRAEMWISKYEKDIGKLQVAVPVAAQPPSVAARTCANCLHNKPPFGNCDGCSQQNDDADDDGNWEPIPEPQGEQEPALVVAYDKQGWRQMLDDMREIPDGTPLYTHQQPKREPLTDAQAKALLAELTGRDPACANDYNWDYELRIIRAIEAAHDIK